MYILSKAIEEMSGKNAVFQSLQCVSLQRSFALYEVIIVAMSKTMWSQRSKISDHEFFSKTQRTERQTTVQQCHSWELVTRNRRYTTSCQFTRVSQCFILTVRVYARNISYLIFIY